MHTNYLAIFVCLVSAFVIGNVWYGPLFKKTWGRVIGMNEDKMTPEQKASLKKSMFGMIIAQIFLYFITVFVLSKMTPGMGVVPSVQLSFIMWFGFVMPIIGSASIWSGKPKNLAWTMFLLMSGCQLLTYLSFGLILGLIH